MASTTQDKLLEVFMTAANMQAPAAESMKSAGAEIATSLAAVVTQAGELQRQQVAITTAAGIASAASHTSAAAAATDGGGVGSTLTSIASTVFKSGLGLGPLIGGLMGLFGGGGDSPAGPPPLVKYALPPSIAFATAYSGSGVNDFDHDQAGMSRAFGPAGNAQGAGNSGPAAPQITVNVQAMDARSFMDRSSDIARAVRDAMLNSNSINDVVSDL